MENLKRASLNFDEMNGSTGYAALKKDAALVDRSDKKLLRLSGKDPAGMLDAILTNNIPSGENIGVYAMLLNPKGRIQTDLRVLRAAGDILIDTESEGAGAASEILGRYAPFSRAKVESLSETNTPWSILGLYGPKARKLLGNLDLTEHQTREVVISSETLLAAGVNYPVPGYDLLGPVEALSAAREHLLKAGAIPADHGAYETIRIESGTPRFGSDITPENFPGETGLLERAVSFQKGCYPGQETVARMHYRGHPNKSLHRLAIEGPSPAPGEPILQNEKNVGAVTSVAPLPVDGRSLALGYLSRNSDPKTPLRAGDTIISVIESPPALIYRGPRDDKE